MKKISIYLLLLVFLFAQACSDDESDPTQEVRSLLEQQDSQISTYLSENNIEAEKDVYGVYWEVLQENPSGREIGEGDVADVTYKLTQFDGTLIGENTGDSVRVAFDSQRDVYYQPFYLKNALAFMREGERYRFYMPFNSAFGNYELANVVPYRGIVVMELEVKQVYKTIAELKEGDINMIERVISASGEDADTLASGVRKVFLEEGEGEQVPDAKDKVGIRYTGRFLNGKVFDTNTGPSRDLLSFVIGAKQVITGMETGVKSMKLGEKALFYIPSAEGYGKSASWYIIPEAVRENFKVIDNGYYAGMVTIPPHTPLVFEVELLNLEKIE